MALVLDTHAVIWYLADSEKLSDTARTIIATEENNGGSIFVSAISLVEVVYLAERGRLPSAALQSLEDALKILKEVWLLRHWMARWLVLSTTSPAIAVPDMPDRIIAATALHLNAELVTRDRRLQAALKNRAIW